MVDLNKGDVWYDPHAEMDFVVKENVNTRGMKVHEMDQLTVRIEYQDGETLTVPHERFRGRRDYERVN